MVGVPLVAPTLLHPGLATALALAPDQSRLAVASPTPTGESIVMYDVQTLARVRGPPASSTACCHRQRVLDAPLCVSVQAAASSEAVLPSPGTNVVTLEWSLSSRFLAVLASDGAVLVLSPDGRIAWQQNIPDACSGVY